MIDNILLQSDLYKYSHHSMYPAGTNKIYSYFCSRGSRIAGVDEFVFFGLQYYIKQYLMGWITLEDIYEFEYYIRQTLGDGALSGKILDDLWELRNLGYLPLRIRALPEGARVPIGVPAFTITNTLPQYYWLPNFVETLLMKVWHPSTCATVADRFRSLGKKYSDLTCDDDSHLPYQFHDFSYRGLSSEESGCLSGAAHLLSHKGSDTMGGIRLLAEYYNDGKVV
ncbi:MAG TPA: nicotinamide phosphoribosyltransferase domain-containing protein, partial [Bacillota bacterium]|nr:nicotinamide phosphoribosyltransferase domain-containing protein [Bacillota bacterium]